MVVHSLGEYLVLVLVRLYVVTGLLVTLREAFSWLLGLKHRSLGGTAKVALLWPLGLFGVRLR